MSKFFIFRLPKNRNIGTPEAVCPTNLDRDGCKRLKDLDDKSLRITSENSKGEKEYLLNELNHGVARQGWGFSNHLIRNKHKIADTLTDLDLENEDIGDWVKNYIVGAKYYWGEDVHCTDAMGRFNIIKILLEMKVGDYVIFPKTKFHISGSIEEIFSHRYFTIAEIVEPYKFHVEDPLEIGYKSHFGHTIKFRNPLSFKYGICDIQGISFTGHYQRATSQVKSTLLQKKLLCLLHKNK